MSKLAFIKSHYDNQFGVKCLLDSSDDESINTIYQLCQNDYDLIDRICQCKDTDIIVKLSGSGCNYVGIYFQFEIENYRTMKRYYKKAIEKGSIDAIYNMGTYYHSFDKNSMVKYYEKAAKQGHVKAIHDLHEYYEHMRNYTTDIKVIYQNLIRTGDKIAIYRLGLYHERKENFKKMIKYYLLFLQRANTYAEITKAIHQSFQKYMADGVIRYLVKMYMAIKSKELQVFNIDE